MKTPIRFLATLFGSLFVIAGSSTAGASAFGPPPADNVQIDVSATSVNTNATATLTVTVTRHNGAPETDGTVVSATGATDGDWWQVRAKVDGRDVDGWASSLWLRRTDEGH